MITIHGKRTRRPALMWLALLCLIAGGAAIAALVRDGHPSDAQIEYIVIPAGIGFFACSLASFIPKKATLEVDGGLVRPSWRGHFRAGPPVIGSWVMATIDAPVGLCARLGPICVGAKDHDGSGYTVDGGPSRSLDFQVTIDELDVLLAQLGAPRATDREELEIALVRSSQSAGGILRTMGPWLATMVLVSAAGPGLFALGVSMITSAIVCGGLIVCGLVATMVLSMRPKRPSMHLHMGREGVVLTRGRDELARAPWSSVRGAARQLRVPSKGAPMILPALSLSIAGHPLELAVWDPEQKWRGEAARTSSPWIAGTPQWRRLVGKLRAFRALDEP